MTVTVEPGTLLGVTGGNGAGKTTLLRTMVGELAPDEGAVHRDGEIGYCPQETVVHPLLSVSQHLELFRTAHGLPDTGHAQDLLGALGCPDAMEQQVGTLSGGTRQKLNLVLALMNRPTLLVLDEPYQGFDWDTRRRFWHLARRFRDDGQAVVVVSHLLHDLQHFDTVYELRDGVLTEGARQR
ncbi:ATP-binding cassette domain-containing protein [Streptomyces sp. NPDC127069]|uniref:ATP-binding cassette domain-containing protein n=1 Tax=Streptomyces sp. NPDC127069 TaxID=3347128 RepID=UPI0036657608